MDLKEMSFMDHYVLPVLDHPVSKFSRSVLLETGKLCWALLIETIKIVAVIKFLKLAGNYLIPRSQKLTSKEIVLITLVAPVAEEVLFRGLLQGGIRCVQNWFNGDEVTEELKLAQQKIRVYTTAFIFGAAHVLNNNHFIGSLIQCSWSFLGGLEYGYLSEKHNTLSVGILFHGINNVLAMAGAASSSPERAGRFILASLAIKLAVYHFFVNGNLDNYLIETVNRTFKCCVAIPGYVVNFCSGMNEDEESVVEKKGAVLIV